MSDFPLQFAARLAVMLPVIMLVVAFAWLAMRRFGRITPDAPFNIADMRTWPLGFALTDAAIYAVVFAAISALMSGNDMSAAVAAGVSAIVAIGLAPKLMQRLSHR